MWVMESVTFNFFGFESLSFTIDLFRLYSSETGHLYQQLLFSRCTKYGMYNSCHYNGRNVDSVTAKTTTLKQAKYGSSGCHTFQDIWLDHGIYSSILLAVKLCTLC